MHSRNWNYIRINSDSNLIVIPHDPQITFILLHLNPQKISCSPKKLLQDSPLATQITLDLNPQKISKKLLQDPPQFKTAICNSKNSLFLSHYIVLTQLQISMGIATFSEQICVRQNDFLHFGMSHFLVQFVCTKQRFCYSTCPYQIRHHDFRYLWGLRLFLSKFACTEMTFCISECPIFSFNLCAPNKDFAIRRVPIKYATTTSDIYGDCDFFWANLCAPKRLFAFRNVPLFCQKIRFHWNIDQINHYANSITLFCQKIRFYQIKTEEGILRRRIHQVDSSILLIFLLGVFFALKSLVSTINLNSIYNLCYNLS